MCSRTHVQWNLSIEGTIRTQLAVLYRECPYFRGRFVQSSIYCTCSGLYREAPLLWIVWLAVRLTTFCGCHKELSYPPLKHQQWGHSRDNTPLGHMTVTCNHVLPAFCIALPVTIYMETMQYALYTWTCTPTDIIRMMHLFARALTH